MEGSTKAKKLLLTGRELQTEEFLREFINEFESRHVQEEGASADLAGQDKWETVNRDMNEISVILANKYKSLLRNIISIKEEDHLNNLYCHVRATADDPKEMALKYSNCFDAFVDATDCVSFKAENQGYLKNVEAKDYFVMAYFAMVTNRRQKNDNLLQLVCSGVNSSGKTTLFENPLQDVCHNFSTEKGVGRFATSAKSTLLIHDCDLAILFCGSDKDRLKAIARTENVTAKTQGSTMSVPPLFLFVTSNQHLMTHTFGTGGNSSSLLGKRQQYPSDVSFGSLRNSEADREAVKNRYVECYVRKRPVMPADALPAHGNFGRLHCIVGLYGRVLATLARYERSDFKSPYLFLYVLCGLAKHLDLMLDVAGADWEAELTGLCERYRLDDREMAQVRDLMKRSQH